MHVKLNRAVVPGAAHDESGAETKAPACHRADSASSRGRCWTACDLRGAGLCSSHNLVRQARMLFCRYEPGRAWLGYGECTELSSHDLKATNEAVMGRPASAYETLRAMVPQNAQGAIDMALLDILGKATKAPVYRVLGGPTRTKARAIVRLAGTSRR